jgi:hypothetical protein
MPPSGADGAPTDGPPAGLPADAPRPATRKDVDYKGAPLDADRGPGLGCFWIQMVALVVAIFLTPLSVVWNWPVLVTIVLFATMLVLLLFVGQTVIFLLRLVAADRRSEARRRPLQSRTKTVGEIEDEATTGGGAASDGDSEPPV